MVGRGCGFERRTTIGELPRCPSTAATTPMQLHASPPASVRAAGPDRTTVTPAAASVESSSSSSRVSNSKQAVTPCVHHGYIQRHAGDALHGTRARQQCSCAIYCTPGGQRNSSCCRCTTPLARSYCRCTSTHDGRRLPHRHACSAAPIASAPTPACLPTNRHDAGIAHWHRRLHLTPPLPPSPFPSSSLASYANHIRACAAVPVAV